MCSAKSDFLQHVLASLVFMSIRKHSLNTQCFKRIFHRQNFGLSSVAAILDKVVPRVYA